MHNITLPIDLDNVEKSVKSVLHRVKVAQIAGKFASENSDCSACGNAILCHYQRRG